MALNHNKTEEVFRKIYLMSLCAKLIILTVLNDQIDHYSVLFLACFCRVKLMTTVESGMPRSMSNLLENELKKKKAYGKRPAAAANERMQCQNETSLSPVHIRYDLIYSFDGWPSVGGTLSSHGKCLR